MNQYTTILRDAATYISNHGWTQANFEDGGSVCLHGAIRACTPLKGDAAIVSGVLYAFGLDYAWNDDGRRDKADVLLALNAATITDAHLEYAFGPQWQGIVALLRRVATLTSTEARKIEESRDSLKHAGTPPQSLAEANSNALIAHRMSDSARRHRCISGIIDVVACGLSLPFPSSRVTVKTLPHVLLALAARHLIGDDFTQADYDFLTLPLRTVLGSIHPDDKDTK